MKTYQFPFKLSSPLLLVGKVPYSDVGLHGSLDFGCDAKKGVHVLLGDVSAVGIDGLEIKGVPAAF
jgi:hypothetical protein